MVRYTKKSDIGKIIFKKKGRYETPHRVMFITEGMYTPQFFRTDETRKTKKKFLSLLSHKRTIYTQHTAHDWFFFRAWVCPLGLPFFHFDLSFFFIHLYTHLRRPLSSTYLSFSLTSDLTEPAQKPDRADETAGSARFRPFWQTAHLHNQ